MKNSAPFYLGSFLLGVSMIHPYLFIARLQELSFFFCMLMIWLLPILITLLKKEDNSC